MTRSVNLKAGDLEPPLTVELLSDGVPLDVSDATGVYVYVVPVGGGDPVVDGVEGVIVDDGTHELRGQIRYEWQTGDTDTAGDYAVEVALEWSTGRYQTFPAAGSLSLSVSAPLA